MTIHRILVPIDYSTCSRTALQFAADLARKYQATLDIVHVWDRPSYVSEAVLTSRDTSTGKSIIHLIQENAERDLAEFLREAALPGEARAGRLLAGDPASALIHELKEGDHDLVVVGTHGRTGLTHVLLGSVAEKLARLSPVPVVIVPDSAAQKVRR
jgi:universal stress protein A